MIGGSALWQGNADDRSGNAVILICGRRVSFRLDDFNDFHALCAVIERAQQVAADDARKSLAARINSVLNGYP